MDHQYLEWPFFSDYHRDFMRAFWKWASDEIPVYEADSGGDGKAAREIFRKLGRGCWLENALPGGPGALGNRHDLRTVCLMRQALAYWATVGDVALSEPWLGIMPVALFGSEPLRRELVPGFLGGDMLPAFALSEPGAGSDAAAIETRATLDGDHYIIDGRKTWTSNAGLADVYVVFARTGQAPGAGGISAFVVDGSSEGLNLEERIPVLTPHTLGTLHFDGVRVPAERVLGEPGRGFPIAMTALEIFRPSVGAAALGIAQRAMDEAIIHAKERTTFNKPLSEHQLIQAKLADMALQIDAAALLVHRAAWLHDTGGSGIARQAAMAKLFTTEAAQEIVDQALQIFGGLGVVQDAVIERLYRHVRAFRIVDGASEIQRLLIARDVLN